MGIFDLDSFGDDVTTVTDIDVEVHQDDVLARIQDHALDVVLLQERFKAAKIALDAATEGLAMSLPPAMREVGEHAVTTSKLLVQTSVAEKFTWDQTVMKEMYDNPDDLPHCMTVKFAVTKTRYESAPEEDRNQLAHALTRSASKPKFKIEAI
jgi:hypothetical protein|tara:strand:- start:1504 stop:1962 length:459 start_codon:yes stop_codon:yes gene_type:complete